MTGASAFILETERLRLRELQQTDFEGLFALLRDPLVMRYYPSTRDAAGTQSWLDGMRKAYAEWGYGLWAVELRADSTFVGVCGLLRWDIDGAIEVEVGYLFLSRHWHNGYATEAARACRDYAFAKLGCPSVISIIRPENLPSRAVAERNGMTVEKTLVFRGAEAVIYRIARSQGAIMPQAFLGFDHVDTRVKSIKAVEPFYDKLMAALGLTRRKYSHVDERGDWHDPSPERACNTVEYYEEGLAAGAPRFIGFIEDAGMQPTLTRIAFRVAAPMDYAYWEHLLAGIGAVKVERSGSDDYPAIFFEDQVGTKLEVCARKPPAAT